MRYNDTQLLKKLKSVTWEYLVSRREALLFRSYTANAYRNFKQVTGLPWHTTLELRLAGDVLYGAEELASLNDIFENSNLADFSSFRKKLIFNLTALEKTADMISRTNFSTLPQRALLNQLNRFNQQALRANNFLLPMAKIDKVISGRITSLLPRANEGILESWLSTLTYPIRANDHVREKRSFYKIALAYQKSKQKWQSLAQSHIKKFGWIGARGYWFWKKWTTEDIRSRLDNFFEQKLTPSKELQVLNNHLQVIIKSKTKLMKKLRIIKSSNLYSLVKLAEEYAYLRTWRTDLLYRSGFKAKGLFEEIVGRAGLQPKDAPYMSFKEISVMAKTAKPSATKSQLAQRKYFTGTAMIQNEFYILAGKKWEKNLAQFSQNHNQKPNQTISGTIAFEGKAMGKVKIVLTVEDIAKVNRGDILVSAMTFPSFIAAMEKASAFVTDEGGILCHAAIISREMKKPCVIGTKIATKVLKDGDFVEVDANNGIIKIIK